MVESKYRTVRKVTWAPTYHDPGSPARQRRCTVAGVENRHQAEWSVLARETTGDTVWVAACDEHLPSDE
jgi:hypothetical protein